MARNILIAIAVLLFLLPLAFAAAPVWTDIPDQEVTAGNLLTFMVAASDADGDIIRLSVENFDLVAMNAELMDNGDGTGTFTWTPNASQVRTYDVIFSARTGEGESQETTLETARITVTAPAATPTLSPEEQEYNHLVVEFNDLEDDYSLNKRRYQRAVDEDDERDIDNYAEKLEDIDDDLADLEDDAEDLLDEVEDSTLANRRELADDIEDLQDDIERVRDRIDDILHDEKIITGTRTTLTVDQVPPVVQPQPERTRVIVGSLDFAGGNVPNTVEEPTDNWPETRKLVWVGAGIVVLIAVIVFLVALLVV